MTKSEIIEFIKTKNFNYFSNIKKVLKYIEQLGDDTNEALEIAEMLFERLYKTENDAVEYLAARAQVEMLLGKTSEAEKHLLLANRKKPKNPFVLIYLSMLHKHEPDKCIDLALQAEKNNITNNKFVKYQCNLLLGCCYLFSSDKNVQIDGLKRLRCIGHLDCTGRAVVDYELMLYYSDKNQYKYQKYSERLNKVPFFEQRNKALLLLENNNYEEAVVCAKNAINIYKETVSLRLKTFLSYVLYSVYDIFLKINQKNKKIIDNDSLIELLKEGSAITPDSFCSNNLGNIYLAEGKINEAICAFKNGADNKLYPNAESANAVALILHRNFKKGYLNQEAVDYYKKAISLGYYESAINLADLYKERGKKYYLYSLNMYKTALRNLDDPELRSKATSQLKELYILMNEDDSKSFDFMCKLIELKPDLETLYSNILKWINEKVNVGLYKIPFEIVRQFAIGIFNALNLICSNIDADFSSSIMSISKGFEWLLKEFILQSYDEYLTINQLKKPRSLRKDPQHETELFFTYETLIEISCVYKEKEKGKKIYLYDENHEFLIQIDFAEFITTKFNIAKNKRIHYIRKALKDIKEIQNIRNSATHCLPLDINELERCLDILFFKNKFVQNFMIKLIK